MKKGIALLLLLTLCLSVFAACGKDSDADGTTDPGVTVNRENPSVSRGEIDIAGANGENTGADAPIATDAAGQAVYQKPVDKEALDLDTDEDISTEDLSFTYDELGRIATCTYLLDGKEMQLEYGYGEDGGISLFGLYDGAMIVDTVYYPTRGFDPALGYTAYDGYYFYGYSFAS